ncbi:septum formation family protein [Frankia sp. R82]|nr:septum formation family protein [Frankia sp. R82]
MTSYLGYSLDPVGRFAPSTIHPLHTRWDAGDRHVVCGLSVRSSLHSVLMPEFTGQVHGADQALVFPAGTCFRRDEQGLQQEVNCDRPHTDQSVGPAALAGLPGSELPSPSEFDRMAAAACAPLHAPYLRQSRFGGATVTAGWHLLNAESWRAGTRSITCLVRFTDAADQPKEVTGRFTPGAVTEPGTVAT